MPGSKQQHIHASAFHLRAFADSDGKIARVTARGEIQLMTPRDAAILKDLITDRDVAPEDRFWFEDALGRVEGTIAPGMKAAIAALELAGPSRVHEHAFTTYLALQYARSEHQGDWITAINARTADATEGVVAARAALLTEQLEQLATSYPYSCFFRCEVPLAHPELPFVPFEIDGTVGVMLAMTPRVCFACATRSFELPDAGRFYRETVTGMPSAWRAVLCATRDAPAVAELCSAVRAARSDRSGR